MLYNKKPYSVVRGRAEEGRSVGKGAPRADTVVCASGIYVGLPAALCKS